MCLLAGIFLSRRQSAETHSRNCSRWRPFLSLTAFAASRWRCKGKLLKRHLAVEHELTPNQYRETFGLKSDYPMAAPSYAQRRREIAFRIGLGRPKKTARRARRCAWCRTSAARAARRARPTCRQHRCRKPQRHRRRLSAVAAARPAAGRRNRQRPRRPSEKRSGGPAVRRRRPPMAIDAVAQGREFH
jgi:ROS/MUCR transcriptional regulator protein